MTYQLTSAKVWDGAAWVAAVGGGSAVDVQVFDTAGTHTWNKPAGAVTVRVLTVGAGGGGGSGRKGTSASNNAGGAGGGGGGASICEFQASELDPTVSVVVAAGGSGGVARTANSTSGADGTIGGGTRFGTFCGANGGRRGPGGTTGAGAAEAGNAEGVWHGGYTSRRGIIRPTVEGPEQSVFTSGGGGGGGASAGVAYEAGSVGSTRLLDIQLQRDLFLRGGGVGGDGSITGNGADGTAGTYGHGGGGGGAAFDDVGNSGAGGVGGDGYCVVVSYLNADVQGFDSSGTWTKPLDPTLTTARIFLVASGGGGGSGARHGTGGGGGGGGCGGAVATFELPLSELPPTLTVTIGAGGLGAASVTTDDTLGIAGGDGGTTIIGPYTLQGAPGGRAAGLGGIGGVTPLRGSSHWGGQGSDAAGPTSNGNGGRGVTTAVSAQLWPGAYTASGGSGGGGNGNRTGGVRGIPAAQFGDINIAGSAAAADATGNNGAVILTGHGIYTATGAGGGGSRAAGGNGVRGSGGGGGGGSANGINSGAGGDGGDGYVCVICV